MSEHEEPEGYEGEVRVAAAGRPEEPARAALAARFDPLAGHVVWTGRVDVGLDAGTELVVTTPHGSARARVTERDVWGNSRIVGVDRPPFPVAVLDESGEPLDT